MKRPQITGLYYITHINNVPSILEHGILSHERVLAEKIPYIHIYAEEIVANRREKQTPDGRSLWKFANLYFQPRNPMLYCVLHKKSVGEVVLLARFYLSRTITSHVVVGKKETPLGVLIGNNPPHVFLCV